MVILREFYLMNMIFRPAILTIVLVVCSILSLFGQCDLTVSVPIEDVTAGSVDIFVDGAANNDLSNPTQGLCGVELFFEHTSIQDISISLQSPAGQQVTLVGPATGAGGNTQFTYWGVEFVPCDSTAAPDLPILDEIFTTEDNWGTFGNYIGEYFPQQGCLEDFNLGVVNGLWTLNFEDVQNFDVGSIDSIGLIFCDETDLNCQECLANGGVLAGTSSDYCESDPNLNLDIEPIFDMNDEPTSDYSYNYVLIQDDEVIQTIEEPNLINYAFGSYQVCGLSSLQIQTDEILDDVIGTEFDELLTLFSDNNYCADLSSNCISINIIEVPDTILTIDTICTGEAVVLDGTAYTETGEYVISFSQAFCDSVSILDLFVIDNQAIVDADSDVISCSDGDVFLDSSNSITSSSTIRNWFKVDGFIDPSISSNISITVTEAGVYGLSLITGMCADTVYYEIQNDDSIPSFDFDVDTLNCYAPSLIIDMTPSITLQSIEWTGPTTGNEEDLSIFDGGMYYVFAVASNGCSSMDSIFVIEDFNVPTPQFNGDTLTCNINTSFIETFLPNDIEFSYNWMGPNIIGDSENSNIQVGQDTTYTLSLENIVNGCIQNFDYEVQIDTNRINYIVESTPISCTSNTSTVTVDPIDNSTIYEWQFQNQGIVGIGDTLIANQIGEYLLIVTPTNGCVDTFYHSVIESFDLPIVEVEDDTLSCLTDSIQLFTITTETDLSHSWSGPGEFESTLAAPFVSIPGVYVVESSKFSGCSVTNVVSVFPGEGIPDIFFHPSDTLDCNVEMITLTPSDTSNLVFAWQSSSIIEDTTAYTIDVVFRGIYPLEVTDTITGCSSFFDVVAPGDIREPIPTIERLSLDCNNTMVILSTSFNIAIDSLRWTSDTGFTSAEQSPEVTQSGEYYLTAVGVNGCSFTDTVVLTENFNLPNITTNIEQLNCLNTSAELSFTTDNENDILSLRLPTGEEIFQNSLTVFESNTYVAIAETSSGCIDSVLMVVEQDTTAIDAMLIASGEINCADSTVTIFVESLEQGVSYDWMGNSIISNQALDTIIVDTIGLYSVTIIDTSFCSKTFEIEVQESLEEPIISSTADTITCIEELANINLEVPDDILSVTWSGPSPIADNLTDFNVDVAGTYFATVIGSNNCFAIDTITVQIDTLFPIVQINSSGILDCDTDLITLEGLSNIQGSSIEWSDNNNVILANDSIQVDEPGIYNLLVTAPNQCKIDTFFNLEIDTISPVITTGPEPAFSCSESKVVFEIETTTNIISYAWEGPLGFESDLDAPLAVSAGLYSVTVTNDRGCTSSTEINVLDDTQGPVIMVRDTFITCDQLAVPLPLETSEVDVSFAWDAPGFSSELQNPETNVEGQYIIYAVLDRNECVTTDTVNVTFQQVPPIYDVVLDKINCKQSEVTLKTEDTDDGVSVTWSDFNFNFLAQDSLTVNQVDSFQLIVLGTNDCLDTMKVVVQEDFEEVDINFSFDNPVLCDNTDVTIVADLDTDDSSIFSASWSSSNGNIVSGDQSLEARISGEGTYLLSVVNNHNGCESLDSVIMQISPEVLLDLALEGSAPNCIGFEDGEITVMDVIGGVEPFQYALNGNVQSAPTFSDLSAGIYNIQVIDDLGCSIDVEYELIDGLDFSATAKMDTTIVVGDEIDLISIFNIPDDQIETIDWSSSSDDDFSCDDCLIAPVSPLFNTLYTLNATSIDGCQDTSEVFIRVIRNPKISVANVFAPGSDENGLFYIQQTSGIEKVLSISVFDKWASRMFLAENVDPGDPAGAWDGTYLGRDVNPGVYVVVAELLLFSGEVVTYAGDITLLR